MNIISKKNKPKRLLGVLALPFFFSALVLDGVLPNACFSINDHSETRLFVKLRDNLLHVKINDVPLDEVLEEISKKTKVTIVIEGSLKDKVTFKARKLPLDEALIKLIEQKADYMFVYSPPSILSEVQIFSKSEDLESEKGSHTRSLYDRPKGRDQTVKDQMFEEIKSADDPEILLSMPLEKFLRDRDPDKRIAIIETLGQVGGDRARELLVSALSDRDEDVRESALYALGKIGDWQVVEPITKCLTDKDSWVRAAAADALAEIGDQGTLPYLIEAFRQEQSDDARKSMEEAIKKLTP